MYFYLYLIIFLILVYTSLYYIFIDEISIYQLSIEHFDFDILYKKQPIVITESIKDIDDLVNKWFNYNIIYHNNTPPKLWERNKFKYCIIYSNEKEELCEINLCNPLSLQKNGCPDGNSKLTTIKLQNNKVLIIPFKWYYNISGSSKIIGIHDYITYFIDILSYK
jgi:hypothetical protein